MVERLSVPKQAAIALKFGAVADGGDEVAAVVEQGADGVQEEGDVVGQGGGGVILRGIGRGGWCDRLHGSMSNGLLEGRQGFCSQAGFSYHGPDSGVI